MIVKTRRRIVIIGAACVCMTAVQTSAYIHKKSSALWPLPASHHGRPTQQQIRFFEQKLIPYFNAKHNENTTRRRSRLFSVHPAQEDFFKIAQYWNLLSPEFKAAYLQASEIPQTMTMHISPRGLFEIYYDTSGIDSVDRTDAYGYGPAHWRTSSSASNGVPDYIDEVAWAFDSAWSMEIDRFQFAHPNPFIDNSHPSQRFKVIVREMDGLYPDGTYGMTTHAGPAAGNAMGLQSFIELRSEWRDLALWSGDSALHTDYVRHPQRGAQVTAVHEFFHAIQFAMTRTYTGTAETFLDDFPETWLEATAVMMEQIGFADIKDYLQYVGSYFDDPTLDLFAGYSDVYTAALLALYLYEHAQASPDISFVKNIFFNNYRSSMRFHDNLDSASVQCGGAWPQLLGSFHTASFFSGSRHGPMAFLPDAALMPQWAIAGDSPGPDYAVHTIVGSSAMEPVFYQRDDSNVDTLTVTFMGDSLSATEATVHPPWNVHGILQPADDTADSVFVVPVSNSGHGTVTINDWPKFSGALFIASNASGDSDHGAAMVFEPCPILIKQGNSAFATGRIASPLSPASFIQASVIAYHDCACSLSLASIAPTAQQNAAARRSRLVPVNGFFLLRFPLTWENKATVSLTMREDSVSCLSLEYKYQTSSAAFSIYQWNPAGATWRGVGGPTLSGATYAWNFTPCIPGFYGLFCRSAIPLDSFSDEIIATFPNPVHLKNESAVKIYGTDLIRLLVYDVRGHLVYRRESETPVSSMNWPVAAPACAPGMYYALIGYKDGRTKGLKQKKQKVVVVP